MLAREDLEHLDYYSPDENYAQKVRLHNLNPMSMVQEFARLTEQTPDANLYAGLVVEEYLEWAYEWELNTKAPQLKELTDLVYVIYGYANAKGWDLGEALRRVHVNNINRCLQPDGTVQRREDGKILKNKDYPKVDLSDLV